MSQKEFPTNALLSDLSTAELEQLQLEQVDLPRRKQLEHASRVTDYAYFPDRGIVSVLASGSCGPHVEIGMVGREGVTGISSILGAPHSPYETFVQVAGAGLARARAKSARTPRGGHLLPLDHP